MDRGYGLANVAQNGVAGQIEGPPQSRLDLILKALDRHRDTIAGFEAIAERACGSVPVAATDKPQPVANGLLDQIEYDLANLMQRGEAVLQRLSRIA